MQENNLIKTNLNPEEEAELNQAIALEAMEKDNPGWQIIKEWLKDMAFHSWVDPRDVSNKEDWMWRELNAFHAANLAKELLESISEKISRGQYLDKVKRGDIDRKKMQI